MPETYGYVRTSRPRVSELAGSDPETQRQQLLAAGVALSHIYQDVGVSGTSGTNSRRGWHSLESRLAQGDTLVVVSIDRIGGAGWTPCRIPQPLFTAFLRLTALATGVCSL